MNASTINVYGDALQQDMIQQLHLLSSQSSLAHQMKKKNMVNHGTFIESCLEHGLSCGQKENGWSGSKVVAKRSIATTTLTKATTEEMLLSPAKAFALWYTAAAPPNEHHNHNHNQNMTSLLGDVWLQDELFPCHHWIRHTD